MTTATVLWQRDDAPTTPDLVNRLAAGLSRIRAGRMVVRQFGRLTVVHRADTATVSIATDTSGAVTVLIGRIDAVEELRARLGVGPAPSPAELLLAAWRRWEARCAEHMIGELVAVVCSTTPPGLLLTRDVMGLVPLYEWHDRSVAVASTHLAGVLAHPAVPREVDEGYVAEILSDKITSREATLFRDVSRVPAGGALLVRPRGTSSWSAHEVTPLELHGRQSADEVDEQYRSILERAVVDRMRAESEVGVHLSGGLDSSTVTAFAARAKPNALNAYSLTFPGLDCDETSWIRAVVHHTGVRSRLVSYEPPGAERLRAESQATWDLPAVPNGAMLNAVSDAARADGVGVLLSGQGGDQCFEPDFGYPAALLSRARVTAAVRSAQRLAPERSMRSSAVQFALRPALGTMVRRVRPAWRAPEVPPWIAPGFAQRVELADRLRSGQRMLLSPAQERLRAFNTGWEAFVRETIALAASRSGVEERAPFYDRRLVEFAVGLDERHRWSDGQFRTIQRRAVRGFLPDVVLDRTGKADFSVALTDQFIAARGGTSCPALRIADGPGWVVAEEAARLAHEMSEDMRMGRSLRHLWPLWLLLAVESWYCAAIEGA